ncbi:putative Pentatricopeptide repeat-containing protein [Melia azedarach]|uniref:Pentatricopeptide repeat-containing protein n=1 Tax=Melia azedarach TaxID=155640 RepID=A0ACC1XYV8_MELAZ|nr:putative Pentatricopeptide repeat-containing protein [Melia azedarach]
MDVNFFSPKSQTLILTTRTSALPCLNPSHLRFIRREFLRPPRTRPKCNKLGLLQTRPSQFPVKASLNSDSNSVLLFVAALVTVTAVTVAYFNQMVKNYSKSSKEVSGSESHASSQQGSSCVDDIIENQTLDRGDLMEVESKQVSEEKNMQETTLKHNNSLLTETLDSLRSDSLISGGNGSLSPKEPETTTLPDPPYVLPESDVVQPDTFGAEMSGLQFRKNQTKAKLDIVLAEPKPIAPLIPENEAHTEVNDQIHHKLIDETVLPETTVNIAPAASLIPENGVHMGVNDRRDLHHKLLDETVLPEQTVNIESTASFIPENEVQTEVNDQRDLHHKLIEETVLPEPTVNIEPSASLIPESEVHIEVTVQKCLHHEFIEETVLPEPTINIDPSASLIPEIETRTEMNGQRNLHHKLIEESEPTIANGVLKEPVREEQYSYHGANQSVLKFPANLEIVKAISSHASPLNGYSLFSLESDTEQKRPELSMQKALNSAEHVEGKIPLACHKESPFCKSKDSIRGRGFPRNNERRHLMQDSSKNLPQLPCPNGMDTNDHMHYISEKIHAYNCLLRDGRLTDCMDLLEDLERKNLLDMNKVYHSRFFNICKSKKEIKEAFRFFKLIPNPTMSTFNMLMSVCASSQDSEGAFQVLRLVQEAGFKADCKLYTTLITTCAKSGKVDAMFEVFHEMVNAGVEPNVHTYGALIDGCAKAGQVAKAFGAYGIMRSKNVKPDRVVFNALITACGQSGAVDRAFDVLAEMNAEIQPIDPDHITIGALIKACANAGQVDRAREVYKMIHKYNIKGTPEVYTIAINCCSQTGDWEFACSVYDDMTKKGVVPDEVFLSALIDFAGHAGKVEAAFEILQEAKTQGIHVGIISYSSLMGACSNAKNWQKALELYDNMKSIKLKPTVSTMNALITALCDGDQLPKAMEVLSDMKRLELRTNTITYSILLVASEKKDDIEVGLILLSQAKEDGVTPSLTMFKCVIGMCSRRFEKARTLGEDILSFNLGRPQIENKWTSLALMVYREAIVAGTTLMMEVVSQVLGCLQLPYVADTRDRLVENLGVSTDSARRSNLCSLIDGFGEYDPRAFSLLQEAASLGIVPCVSFKESPVVVDARKLEVHIAKVYFLTVLKGLKHRLAAGTKLPNVTILLPVDKTQIMSMGGEKTINLAGRTSQAVAALLRRLRLGYQGNESYGKIRINGLALKRWFQPKLASPFSGKPGELRSLQLGKGITHQQRNIRTGNFSLE